MSTVLDIEQAIQHLSPDQLGELRQWFADYDAEAWDRQIEQDIQSGLLDELGEEALKDSREGRCKDL